MRIRSHLIRFAAGIFAVMLATGLAVPVKAAQYDVSGFAIDGDPPSQIVGTIVGSGPTTLSMELIPNIAPSGPGGGLDGTMSVDVGAPIVSFVVDVFGLTGTVPLEVGVVPGSGIFAFVLLGNFSLDVSVTALLSLFDAELIPPGPVLRITLEGGDAAFRYASAAVPLPSALPLFAAGLGAFGLLHWRRKRRTRVT